MTKTTSPAPAPVLIPSDATLLAENLLLSVTTREVVADAATRIFFNVPEKARTFPIIGKSAIEDTVVALRPGVVEYNSVARMKNAPAARITGANRWSGPLLQALRLTADKDAAAGERLIGLGLLAPSDAN
jgi:hypothetical protein